MRDMPYLGLSEIIERLIQEIPHPDPKITNDMRYNTIMRALFGDDTIASSVKLPVGVTHEEIYSIVNNQDKITSNRKLIEALISEPSKRGAVSHDTVAKHIQRNKLRYISQFDGQEYWAPTPDEARFRTKKIQEIFNVLESAGWF